MIYECFIDNFDGNIPFFYLDSPAFVYFNHTREHYDLINVFYSHKDVINDLFEIMSYKAVNFDYST